MFKKIFSRITQSYMDFVRGIPRGANALWLPLVPAGWIAGAGGDAFDFLYRHGLKRVSEPPIPVISVGNLSYGGTNKTPFVETLCRMVAARGVPVGIVSRGYGGTNADVLVFEGGRAERRVVGDEPLLLSARLPGFPVAVSRDRMRGVRELAERGVRLAVADDAFQHRRMARDVDVVLIDATCPFGNGRFIPAGILREPPENLSRAHIVVVTRAEQIDPQELEALHRKLSCYLPRERIFNARLSISGWALWDGRDFRPWDFQCRRVAAFSAIGNPESFIRSLKSEGAEIVVKRHFRDHHLYSLSDMEDICELKRASGAEFLTCTEKDIYNLPSGWSPSFPLAVPRVTTALDEPERFWAALVDCLRPRIVVASNGYGEDAIGVLVAEKLRDAYPAAEVLAFPLVGRGDAYKARGFTVASTPSVTPSGGVVKYRLRDLLGDIRAGLFGHIREQQKAWRKIAGGIRTPVCVGDVYLLLHTLWGQGIAPLFVAAAKTVRLSGHWRLERFIIRHGSLRAWTRDQGTADELAASGAEAVYAGNPVMDLLGDIAVSDGRAAPFPRIMLLPGSRLRAYDDVNLLLEALEILCARLGKACVCVMVLAPTIDPVRLARSCAGWILAGQELAKGDIRIRLHVGDIAEAASGTDLLIGLGGTANQLCAGMGIPVVSIDEKGKRVQKKLLGDAEILVEPTPDALADCACAILSDPELYKKMSAAGKERMGRPGALADVTCWAGAELGWSARCQVYEKLII